MFRSNFVISKRVTIIYDMRVNTKNGFVANVAAVCEPVNSDLAAGIVDLVNILFAPNGNITELIVVGSPAIFSMGRL